MDFNPGFYIKPITKPMGFEYGEGTFGPKVENRFHRDIRPNLRNPDCKGPEVVYSITMDVGKKKHKDMLEELHLLFRIVTYSSGSFGNNSIRSQGHIHSISSYSNMSTPEIYEIWNGKAIIYMQETAKDYPGKCYAVEVSAGEVVIVPPGWAYATISADYKQPLTFGAWCDREYEFEYDDDRAHKGLARFPILDNKGEIRWKRNKNYEHSELIIKNPENYINLGIEKSTARLCLMNLFLHGVGDLKET